MTPTPVLSAQQRLAEKARQERRARRTAVLRRAGWAAGALAPFALLGWLLLASPWLVVHHVVVKGEKRLTAAQVLAAADVPLGTPLARVDTGAIAARIEALGAVASVDVSRAWPDTLEVTIVERQPVVAVRSGPTWSLYDGSGALVGAVKVVPPYVVRLAVKSPGPQDPATRAALAVLHDLPAALRRLVVGIQAPTAEQVTLLLTGRRVVVWGGTSDGAQKAAVLVPLLKLPGHVYDVSSPSVVTRR